MDKPQEHKLTTADMAAAADKQPPKPVMENPRPMTPGEAQRHAGEGQPAPLLQNEQAHMFRGRWDQVQTGFVDEPRQAVEQADSLVAEVMQQLAKTFADERTQLENQWSRGDNVSTEDLRVALQRYRSFFTRLLSV